MAEEFSSSRIQLHNNTYVDNKDYGYPAGALTLEDSLHFPTLVDVSQSINVSELITTLPGAFCSFRFFAEAGTTYEIFPNVGNGTADLLNGSSLIEGDSTYHTFTVNITDVGAGGYQLGINISEGLNLPVSQAQKLTASDSATNNRFGMRIAQAGDTIVVGAPYDDAYGASAGAVYIFERDSEGLWQEIQKLVSTDSQAGDFFGNYVNIWENTLTASAHGDDTAGAFYVFNRNVETGLWSQTQKLQSSDGSTSDNFGSRCFIAGDTIIATAGGVDTPVASCGAAYAFDRDVETGVWSETQKIQPNDPTADHYFGSCLSVDGGILLIGCNNDDSSGLTAGSAYAFERNSDTGIWVQTQKIKPSDISTGDFFGTSIQFELSTNTLVVSASKKDTSTGAVYTFLRDPDTGLFTQSQKLVASDASTYSSFGYRVALDTNTLIVGAYEEDNTGETDSGAAYIFERNPDTGIWSESQRLMADDRLQNAWFGAAVHLYKDTLAIGSPGNSGNGAVYIY